MFKTDQKAIETFAKQDANNVAEVCRFVLLTIQRNFAFVKPIMRGECEINTTEITKKGIAWAKDNAEFLYNACYGEGLTDAERLLLITTCPGLGLPKAGFVLQLCTGKTGCLDSHNIKRFGLKASAFSISGASQATRLKKAQKYVETCQRHGGSESLWDSWCDYVAKRHPKLWNDGEQVSKAHCQSFGL